jgi:prefoldin subunit 5
MSLEGLLQQETNTSRSIQQCQARINTLQGYVNDLSGIYDDMQNAKSDAQRFRNDMRAICSERHHMWAGSLFNGFQNYMLNDYQANCQTVINQIDRNMTTVNNKLRDYQNEIFTQQGALGNLRALLNSIRTAIQNWVN